MVLSTIKEDHEFFSKSYVPTADDSKYSRAKKKTNCSNVDGFFNGLPVKNSNTNSNSGHFPIRDIIQPRQEPTQVRETEEVRQLRKQLTKVKLYGDKKEKQFREAQNRAQQFSAQNLGAAAAGSFFTGNINGHE